MAARPVRRHPVMMPDMHDRESLWIVCAHPPHIDPRVTWSADFARNQGYDVSVFGLKHGITDTRIDETETLVAAPATRTGWVQGLKRFYALGLRPATRDVALAGVGLLPIGLILGPIVLLLLLVRLGWTVLRLSVRSAVSVSDALLRALPKGDAASNLLRHGGRVLRNRIGGPILSRTGPPFWKLISPFSSQSLLRRILRLFTRGRLGELTIALDGYRWYLFDHALPLAEYVAARAKESSPAIVHAHDPDGLIAAIAVKKVCDARVIFDAHEYGPDAYLLKPRPRFLFRMIERSVVPHVDAAFGVSTPLIRKWTSRFPRTGFTLLPNASPLSDLEAEPLPAPAEVTGREDRLKILFQGGFAPERGVDRVISEWVQVEGADLYLRGPDGERRERLVQIAKDIGLLNKSVFFLPSLPEDQLIAGAGFADIGLIPYASTVENHAIACPNKLGQFMMAELMILSTPLPFVKEIITAGECGLIYDDQSDGALADVANRLAMDRDFVDRGAQNAKRYARETYHYEAYASTVIGAYYSHNRL